MTEPHLRAGEPCVLTTRQVPVTRVVCPNAGPMTGPGTNTYLIGNRTLALLDPGPAIAEHTHNLLDVLAGRTLQWILVTHTHGDHSPGAAALAAATGAQLVGLAPAADAQYQDRTFQPQQVYRDGDVLSCDEYTLRLLHTPGHVGNHLCFLLEEEGMLFTGDHILQGTTPVILPPDGDMAAYLTSLRRLAAMPLQWLAPGHGEVMAEPAQMIETLIRHRLRREQKIVSVLRQLRSADLDELVVPVYDDVPAHLLPWAKKTLLAHLIKLRSEGQVTETPDTRGDISAGRWHWQEQ